MVFTASLFPNFEGVLRPPSSDSIASRPQPQIGVLSQLPGAVGGASASLRDLGVLRGSVAHRADLQPDEGSVKFMSMSISISVSIPNYTCTYTHIYDGDPGCGSWHAYIYVGDLPQCKKRHSWFGIPIITITGIYGK